jgi:hypothetical protein
MGAAAVLFSADHRKVMDELADAMRRLRENLFTREDL